MSIFAETVAKAISDYRYMLRRYLPQSDRVSKLSQLKLKDPSTYKSDIALYHAANAIIIDMEKNMDTKETGYYSYSGIGNFCRYLKEFLDNYHIEGDQVVHCAQVASRAMVQAIQLITLPSHRLNADAASKIKRCNLQIAQYGSVEQRDLHLNNLERQHIAYPEFYQSLLDHFKEQLSADELAEAV